MDNEANRPVGPEETIYVIQTGDSLYRLARRFDTTMDDILSANPGFNPDQMQVGEQISIPNVSEQCSDVHTVQPWDSIYSIARQYGVAVQDLVDANPNIDPDDLEVGRQICIPEVFRPTPFRPTPSRPTPPRPTPSRPTPPRGLPSQPSRPTPSQPISPREYSS